MSTRPNVLWIVTTQWRAGATGYAGDPNARTPNLDRLAAESIDFAQAVTPHPFGPFARAALLTGVPSPANGVVDYFDPLPSSARTIAHELRSRRYATGFFGKWHLGRRDRSASLVGEAHARVVVPESARGGFDYWEGFESGFLLNDAWLHGTALTEPTQFAGYQSDVVCARAAEWRTREPWFRLVSLEAPHPPYDAPSAGMVPRAPSDIVLPFNVPRGGPAEERARRELAGYYAHIEATDRALGRVLASLAADGRTIVVFTSVHGDMHGAHGLFRKGWPHEESVRVPLLVRVPGIRPQKSAAAVSLVDLAALTLAWTDGSPALPANDTAAISMPSVVALPHQCDRAWRGIRSPKRKLVLAADGSPWLFFDLERDPGERVNLIAEPGRAGEIAHWKTVLGFSTR
jgi:arylsulfatase A-like enzyme